MSKDFAYPRFTLSGFLASLIAVVVFGMIARGLWSDAFESKGYGLNILVFMVFLALVFCIAYIILMNFVNMLAIRRIITSDEFIVIKGILGSRQLRWVDIIEFGRYRVRAGAYGFWVQFYLKAAGFGDQKIKLCTNHLFGIEELIQVIFNKAASARFVTIQNAAWLPFSKRIEIFPWQEDGGSDPSV